MRATETFSLDVDTITKFREVVPKGKRSAIVNDLLVAYADDSARADDELNAKELLARLETYKAERAKFQAHIAELKDKIETQEAKKPRQETIIV